MNNDGTYFQRLERTHRNAPREYPGLVFPFGDADLELFAHESHGWEVTEKKTGLLVARGATMDEAVAAANKRIEEYGREKVIALVKDTFEKINQGLEYNPERKEWVNQYEKVYAPEISGAADD